MTDIFDAKILCKNCNREMKQGIAKKDGAELRAMICSKCGDKIIHPADLNCLNHFNDLKGKKFDVKLRIVGNSHAISIPKEIVDFIEEQRRTMFDRHSRMRREMDEMVRLAFDDFNRISLNFGGFDDDFDDEDDNEEDEDEEYIKGYKEGARKKREAKEDEN